MLTMKCEMLQRHSLRAGKCVMLAATCACWLSTVQMHAQVPGSRVGRLPSWVDKVRPFFLGMGSGDSVLLPQADTNEPRDEDLAFFEREPQTGDVINTEGGAQILGGQSIDISRSNGNKPRRGKLSERAGMQRHEVESTSEPASGQVLETEVLEPVSRGGGSGRGRRAQQLKERDATQRSEQDENDMELLTTQQAARKAGVSTAELTAMRARQQAIEVRLAALQSCAHVHVHSGMQAYRTRAASLQDVCGSMRTAWAHMRTSLQCWLLLTILVAG